MKLLLRDVRADKRRALITQLNSIARQEIEKVLDEQVKPALVKSHELVVRSWKSENRPGFAARKFIEPDQISVNVFPTGTAKQKLVWTVVDQGAKPHTIPERTPKKASVMVFQAGGRYIPKTLAKPARVVAGGGRVRGGKKVFAKRAKAYTHPGSEAREFSKTIGKDIQPDFRREVENAFRRTADKVQE